MSRIWADLKVTILKAIIVLVVLGLGLLIGYVVAGRL